MHEATVIVLFLVSFLLGLVGLASLIYPLKFLGIRTRRRGLVILGLGLTCFVAFAVQVTIDAEERAVAAGFESAQDQDAAKAEGFSDAEAWLAEKQKRREGEEAAARRQREIAAAEAAEKAATEEAYRRAEAARAAAEAERRAAIEAFFTLPARQEAFIQAVSEAREAFRAAANGLARGGTRAARREALCSVLKSRSVKGWVGRIVTLSSNADGKGVLSVELADGLAVKTWNNELADMGADTLISPSSRLFARLAALKEGDRIRFSGTFLPSDVDCIREASLTQSGSMRDPEFIFRFRSVERPESQ